MKTKTLGITLSLLACLSLAGCSTGQKENSSEKSTPTTEQKETASQAYFQHIDQDSHQDSRLTYYLQGDLVTKQKAENVLPYSILNVDSEEESKEILEPIAQSFANKEGISHSFTYEAQQVRELIEVDYSKAKLEDLENIPGFSLVGDTQKGDKLEISFKTSKTLLEKAGFREIKDGKFEDLAE